MLERPTPMQRTARAFLLLFPLAAGFHRPTLPCHAPLRSQGLSRCSPTMARGNQVRDREESKRQSRVSQVIRSELAGIIRRPGGVKSSKTISETLRQKISIVDVQMSPDLRSAKVFVSVFGTRVEGREAYAWLVKHAKPMKHALSQSISHMKSVPDLHFKQTDIASAVDVMLTLDKLAAERRGQVDDADLHGINAMALHQQAEHNFFGSEFAFGAPKSPASPRM